MSSKDWAAINRVMRNAPLFPGARATVRREARKFLAST